MMNSFYELRLLDDLARQVNSISKLHPLVKLLTTVIYIAVVVSFGRYQISGLLPFFIYPAVVLSIAELPLAPVLKRICWVMPLVIGIGIFNPVFDNNSIWLLGFNISRGWITFGSILIKGFLTVTAGVLLIATTPLDSLGAAMRRLHVPRIFVLQLLLTYRYISVLGEEASRMKRAYSMRAPDQRGIQSNAWGSFMGNLLLRSYDRAQRVYDAMCLRGFSGEYHVGSDSGLVVKDIVYILAWSGFFVLARIYDLSYALGSLIVGVIR